MSTTSPPTPLRSPLPLSPRIERRTRPILHQPSAAVGAAAQTYANPNPNPPSTPNNHHQHHNNNPVLSGSQRHIRAPSNIARLQSNSHSSHSAQHSPNTTLNHNPDASASASASSLNTRSGLKPLNMSSLNLPPSPSVSTSSNSTLRSKILTTEEKDRRRRSMIVPPSVQSPLPDVDLEITPSGRKLKRLSLCAGGSSAGNPLNNYRSPSLELERSSSGSNNGFSAAAAAPASPLPLPSLDRRPSTPASSATGGLGGAASRRPDRRIGVRASISYSPAPPQIVHTPRTGERRSYEDDWEVRMGLGEGYDVMEPERDLSEGDEDEIVDGEERVKTGGQTLTERHADLLTLIAQRERRVNELKQELRQQEASLNTLKSRWTSIVSRSALSPTSTSNPTHSRGTSHAHAHVQTNTHTPVPTRRARPVSMISTSTSSASSLSLATIDEPTATTAAASAIAIPNGLILPTGGLSSTGAAVLSGLMAQTEGYLGPEVVEGGKRFLGTLWRTVGAAAGGTVPEQDHEHEHEHGEYPAVSGVGLGTSSISSSSGMEKRKNEKEQERRNAIETQRETKSAKVDGEDWSQFGPKLDLSNIQRMITPWNTPTPTSAGLTSTSSSSSRTPYDSRSTMRRERKESNNNNNRSNTVTPTSFYANRIAGSPISARMMPPLSPSHARIELPEDTSEIDGEKSAALNTSGLSAVPSSSSTFKMPTTVSSNAHTDKTKYTDAEGQVDVRKRELPVSASVSRPSGNGASVDAKDDDGGEGWGW
ncbi:hypothetical protein IAT40_004253 [Kwoniella sp. CBS 6097]